MLFKNLVRVASAAMVPVFCAVASSYASVANADAWQDFGDKVLYSSGSRHCGVPDWLRRREPLARAFAEPNSLQAVLAVETFLQQALEGYDENNFLRQGRMALHKNPRCILGLFLTGRFAGTELGRLGSKFVGQAIERSCRVVFGTEAVWKQRLEHELAMPNKAQMDAFTVDLFGEDEVPFLLIYLVENGSSTNVRHRSQELLGRYLEERYGLEPALRQYRPLFLEQGYTVVNGYEQLRVARLFRLAGGISDAQELYEKILQNTDTAEIAISAVENLARINIENSQQGCAYRALNFLFERFPGARLADEGLKSLFLESQAKCEKGSGQLIREFTNAHSEEEALKLCRLCRGLWTKEEAINRWRCVIANAEPESVAWECARLSLAEELVDKGQVNEADDILHGLLCSINPTVQARALLISADMARRLNSTSEAVSLYQQAAQIERLTSLPEWSKAFRLGEVDAEKLSPEELSFFASFLRGYNELVDGNFKKGAANLLKARQAADRLPGKLTVDNVRRTIPNMLMLAYLKMGDYARAEEYGLEAMRIVEEEGQASKKFAIYPPQIERVDNSMFVLSGSLRTLQTERSKSQVLRNAKKVYANVTSQGPFKTDFGPDKSDLIRLYWHIKRQRVSRLLSAEYEWAKARLPRAKSCHESLQLEPVVFAAELLSADSFEHIQSVLRDMGSDEHAGGRMYRFAKFADGVGCSGMASMALDASARGIDDMGSSVQLPENIADMYLARNSPQKAIEIYESIVKQASGRNEAERAQYNLITVYAEKLKLYDKAIQQCRRFLKNFPDGERASQVKFLMAKFAYLNKDYAGSIQQLSLFQQRYPGSPQVGEAKMLVALSRMLEGGTQDAINLLAEIIQKYPEDELAARSKFLIGYLEVSQQQYSEALETFRELVEQFPASRYIEQSQRFIERLTEPQICDLRHHPDGRESSLSAQETEGPSRPNVLLIGIETLRADHVGCLGYFRDTTPTLDKLAKEGVVFSRAVAASSWTIPAVMSVFTSFYPGVHRTTDHRKKLPEKIGTLAEVLEKNGFMTAAFVSTTVLDSRHGFSRGFDLYDDFSVQLAIGLDLFGKNETAKQGIFSGAPTSEPLNRAAISWLRKNHHKPFFMFVFYFDPHSDYVPPAPFDTVFDPGYEGSIDGRGISFEPKRSTCPPKKDLDHLIALYDGEILYTDGYISDLLEKFEEYGILDRTLVVVFGDHGEQFYEHGSASHGWTLYNEVIDVPLIFRWPPMVAKGTTVSAIVSQVDVMSTILDYLDVEYDGFVQGSSLRPLIEGQKDKLHEVVYAELNIEGSKVFSAAIGKDHKFILDLNTGGKQLFDLSVDSREQESVYPVRILSGPIPLEGRLMRYLADNERLTAQLCGAEESQKVELDEVRIRQLKALGYLR